MKFAGGGTHISRTSMLEELGTLLGVVPQGAAVDEYRDAVLSHNVLGKTTDSTRQKSLRHLRELDALDEGTPIFGLLRKLHAHDPASLPHLAIQVAWCRDQLLRTTTPAVLDVQEGDLVVPATLAEAVETAFPRHYSEKSRGNVSRNAGSSWTGSGHPAWRPIKIRRRIPPSPATLALFLGNLAGFHGAAVFSNPWCRLLDLDPERARRMGLEAHRAGLLNLRAIGEVVEISFPLLAEFQNTQISVPSTASSPTTPGRFACRGPSTLRESSASGLRYIRRPMSGGCARGFPSSRP